MNISKLKNKNIACFSKKELKKIFEMAKKTELLEKIRKQDISFENLQSNYEKMTEVAGIISKNISNDRNDHEIFASIFVFSDFYENKSEICFELKDNFNTNRDKIITLQDLNNFRNDPPDFIIKSSDGFREFELKRYRNGLNTKEVFEEVKKRIEYYQNGLGNINLLFIIQSFGNDISNIDFHELNSKIKSINSKFQGQILISYNENNKDIVINQIFPNLTTTRIPVQLPSQRKNIN